jgi:hypothetical protein
MESRLREEVAASRHTLDHLESTLLGVAIAQSVRCDAALYAALRAGYVGSRMPTVA